MRLTSRQKYMIQISLAGLLLFCWKFELGDLLAFIGSIIGVLGAYYIFDMGRRFEVDDKVSAFYEMINYTLENTEVYLSDAVQVSKKRCLKIGKEKNYSISEIKDMTILSLKGLRVGQEYSDYEMELFKSILESFENIKENDKLSNPTYLDRLIYYKNWDECIPYIKEDREVLISWVLYLQDSSLDNPVNEYKIDEFILRRTQIVNLINKTGRFKHKTVEDYVESEINRYIKRANMKITTNNETSKSVSIM